MSLFQAVKTGNILVIDEADKAPTNVTCILKSLAENGEMILSGRRHCACANRFYLLAEVVFFIQTFICYDIN
jgi:hypothetical protein